MINANNVWLLTNSHVITVKGLGETGRTAHVLQKDSMTVLFYLTLELGIASPASMINAINVWLLTKTHVTTARERGEVELIVHVLLMDTTMHLFWRIIQLGIANPASMISVNNVWLLMNKLAIIARGMGETGRTAHVLQKDSMTALL